MKIIRLFMVNTKAEYFIDFIIENIQVKHNFNGLLASHYGCNVFDSSTTRMEYLKPNIKPFAIEVNSRTKINILNIPITILEKVAYD